MSYIPQSLTCVNTQSIPSDSTKIRSILGGWLYAYETPPAQTVAPTSRADSPDEVRRQLKVAEVRRERAMSLHTMQEERKRAKIAQANFLSHDKELGSQDVETVLPVTSSGDSPESHDNKPESHDMEAESMEVDSPNQSHDSEPESHDMDTAPATESQGTELLSPDQEVCSSAESAKAPTVGQPSYPEPMDVVSSGLEGSDGFVFAIHRRMVCVRVCVCVCVIS